MKSLLPLKHRHDKAILALAVPAVGSLAIDPLVSLVDTAFVGRLGTAELGALGINAAVFALTFLIFNFLAYGTTPQIGRAVGRGDRKTAGRVVIQALSLGAIVGCMATAALLLFSDPILSVMGAEGLLREPASQYLRVRAFAGPAVLIMIASHGAFRGYQDTRTPFVVSFVLNLINLILDPILIFVLGWGIVGAAAATVIAQWTGALIFLYLLLVRHREAFGVKLVRPSLKEMVPLLQIGGHLMIRTGSLVATMTLATAVAARLGVVEVAAHQVANQLWGFLALVIDALAIAGQALLARHIGEDSPEEARAVGNRLLQWGIAVGLLLGLLFWVARPYLPAIFTTDAETVAMLLPILIFVAILQPINGLVFVWDGLFMGAEAFRYLAYAMILSSVLAAAILLSTPSMGWGLAGVWWAITAMMLIRTLTLAVPWFTRRVPGLDK